MPAIVRNAACAAFLWILPAVAADPEKIRELLLELSTSLEAGNAARFLGQLDRQSLPGYAVLENNVVALLAQYEVASSVGVTEQTSRENGYDLKLDWLLQIRPASGDGPAQRRRQDVRCRIEPRGKRWKVTVLEPAAFFKP